MAKKVYLSLEQLYHKPSEEFTSTEARQYFDWYIENIPQRVQYLEEYSRIKLDYTMNSLEKIWKWFIRHAEAEKEDDLVIEKMMPHLSKMSKWEIKKHLNIYGRKFTAQTNGILFDITMYFGEVGVREYRALYWGYHTDKKRDSFANKPLLMGFEDRDFSPPFKAHFDPEFIVKGAADGFFHKDINKRDLVNMYKKWERMIFDD